MLLLSGAYVAAQSPRQALDVVHLLTALVYANSIITNACVPAHTLEGSSHICVVSAAIDALSCA